MLESGCMQVLVDYDSRLVGRVAEISLGFSTSFATIPSGVRKRIRSPARCSLRGNKMASSIFRQRLIPAPGISSTHAAGKFTPSILDSCSNRHSFDPGPRNIIFMQPSLPVRPVLASPSELPNLDFLRAIAVLSVYVAHVLYTIGLASGDASGAPDLGWFLGRFGVLVFFVHTSFVLMMSLERMERDNRPLFRAFYVRRLFRIFPLSIACVAIVVLFRLPYSSRLAWFNPDWSTILANFLLCTDLFHKKSVISVLWTLPLEVQMYLLLPIVYLIGRRYRGTGIAFLWLAAILGAYIQPHISSRLYIASYVPCFMAGVAGYFAGSGMSKRKLPFVGWPLVIAAAAGIFFEFGSRHRYEVWWIMCLAIGLSAPMFADLRFSPLRKASAWVAKYSYGIYLTHMYALWAAFSVCKNQPLWVRSVVLAVLSTALPVLFYEFLEFPMIRLGAHLANRLTPASPAMHWSDRFSAGWTRLFTPREIEAQAPEVPSSARASQ
jgi:peptidoglycan/LPS O-acetylase OafA/YrhL